LLYVSVGRLPKALQHAERLTVLDPVESVGLAMVGFVHLLDGRPELGLEHILRAGLDRNLPWHAAWLAWAFTANGREREALAQVENLRPPDASDIMLTLCWLIRAALLRDRTAFAAVLPTRQAFEASGKDPAWSWWVADFCALVGDHDAALEWLERARSSGFINYPVLATSDRFLTGLRADPRFQDLIARIKREWEAFEV
jgi:hypothetical protein